MPTIRAHHERSIDLHQLLRDESRLTASNNYASIDVTGLISAPVPQ